jgi:hypothetical protein
MMETGEEGNGFNDIDGIEFRLGNFLRYLSLQPLIGRE